MESSFIHSQINNEFYIVKISGEKSKPLIHCVKRRFCGKGDYIKLSLYDRMGNIEEKEELFRHDRPEGQAIIELKESTEDRADRREGCFLAWRGIRKGPLDDTRCR
jgi:hypothetical protein